MVRAVAINVAANTNQPGVRGPIRPDGSFEYVPIPESEPTTRPVPTYADLDLAVELPDGAAELPVHLDPEFAEYPRCERYTYGDPFGVKARPLLELERGDYVFFYATLTTVGDPDRPWIAPDWGAYVIGQFRLAREPVPGTEYAELANERRAVFENNAHVKRAEFDAAVLLEGTDAESGLYETAVPLSTPESGATANRVVTELSSDSGKGPWWRRPMKFEEDGVAEILRMGVSTDS
ncbi:Nmad3 family putative nucleotide modification protein [Haladaptatus sp. NG-WS-4]